MQAPPGAEQTLAPHAETPVRQSSALAARLHLTRHDFAAAYTLLRDTVSAAMEHDFLTISQATAYSAIVSLFPAMIVTAAVVSLLPESLPLRTQLGTFFDRILPSNVSPIIQTYFETTHKSAQTARALLSAAVVSFIGAGNVMATLMESFRRAFDLPLGAATFWQRRRRALLLVPLSLAPMTVASALVVFGHWLTVWLAAHFAVELRTPLFVFAVIVRWVITIAASVGIIGVIYHLGTDVTRHMRTYVEPLLELRLWDWSWRNSLPGAALATVLWFLSTLLFGLYVTRFANYGEVYGSLGAAIALLFWLYLIALSIVLGAEFNAQLAHQRHPYFVEMKSVEQALDAGEDPAAG
jgi:membrane protein